ncbi:hypothetical protein RI367_005003 [Sorochytrium milnesiophthora]
MFRPLWVGSAKMCVLVTPAWPSEYELWYTLPHLDSAEKCITDTRLQRRHAAVEDIVLVQWLNGNVCAFWSAKNVLGYIKGATRAQCQSVMTFV